MDRSNKIPHEEVLPVGSGGVIHTEHVKSGDNSLATAVTIAAATAASTTNTLMASAKVHLLPLKYHANTMTDPKENFRTKAHKDN